MKKRLLMIFVVILLLVGCGSTDTPDTEVNTQQTETESIKETLEVNTEVVSETTTEVSTETESEIITEVETETQTESEVPSEPEAPTYTYTDLDKTMYVKSSVNVRSLPSTDGEKLGGFSKAQEVHVTGQCNETNWYRIEYNGGIGYVSNNYLQDSKPVEEEPIQPSEPTVESFPGQLNYIYDNGDNVYFYYLNTEKETGSILADQSFEILEARAQEIHSKKCQEWLENGGEGSFTLTYRIGNRNCMFENVLYETGDYKEGYVMCIQTVLIWE